MKRIRLAAFSGVVLGTLMLGLCGCATTMEEVIASDGPVTAAKLRGATIDDAASEIHWEPGSFFPMEPAEQAIAAKNVRGDISKGFNAALGAGERNAAARYKLRVIEADSNLVLMVAPCFIFLTLFGCPAGVSSAKVELALDVDGEIFKATGEASRVEFLFSSTTVATPAGVVVADAVADALRQIDAQAGGVAK
jgi:hypothetical protein